RTGRMDGDRAPAEGGRAVPLGARRLGVRRGIRGRSREGGDLMSTRYAPESVLVEGEVWRIARVWPGAPAPLEAHQGARVSGGHLLPDGTVRLLSPQDDAKLPALGALAQR